jgi:hypothetical protein
MLPFAIVPVPYKDQMRYKFSSCSLTEDYLNNGGKDLTGKVCYVNFILFL